MQISVVIPTCDRRDRLLSLLDSLNRSSYPFLEVIVVDSGKDKETPPDYTLYNQLSIIHTGSESSVCIQRNTGIRKARGSSIFLCDDDIEVPSDYIRQLVDHMQTIPDTGAVSGLVLQHEKGEWTAKYPLRSSAFLLCTFIFQWSIWGEIDNDSNNPLIKKIKRYYARKGNHISRAGWPVLTDFTGDYFTTPLYALGACLIKKDWLLSSPYDEVLDRHGIGDNYGVAMGFPGNRIDVLTRAFVYHHMEPANRLLKPLQYFRRALALDYFISKKKISHVKRPWLLWSLTGKLGSFILSKDKYMIRPACASILQIAFNRNPFRRARAGQKVLEPVPAFTIPLLWVVFAGYVLLLGYGIMHHELWGDEVHSWNISKASGSYPALIANMRYEGHPPGWYTVLWLISRATHQVIYMQMAQWLIAGAVTFIVLFLSPFSLSARILIPFGYYFLFEYGLLSRNYALGILLAFGICLLLQKDFKYKSLLYYVTLYCLSNIHMLALLLAASIHFYFLLSKREQRASPATILIHALAGLLVLLPAAWFILPPADSQLNMPVLLHIWNADRFASFYEAPLRAFFPLPAWWQAHFWNSQFLLEAQANYPLLIMIAPLISLALLSLAFSVLWKSKKSAALFAINLLAAICVSITFFPLTTARYTGFIYIGFLVAWWLSCSDIPVKDRSARQVNILLAIQLAAGLFTFSRDIRLPFSNTYKAADFIKEVPAGEKWVTDYWTLNAIEAFTDRPAWCIDLQENVSFLVWNSRMTAMQKKPHRFSDGLTHFFKKEGCKQVYMITQTSLPALQRSDSLLSACWKFTPVDSKEGAIEKGSNLYLYRINSLP